MTAAATLVAAISAFAGPAAATTAVSGSLNVVANSTIDATTVTDLQTGGWASVPAGLVENASATVVNGADFIVTTGSATAGWTSADAGSVHFANYGWNFNVNNPSTTAAASNLTQGRGGDDWSYTFTATQNGTITLNYNVFPTTGSPFGLWGWGVDWNGGGGSGFPFLNPNNPTQNGVFTAPLVSGQTYTIGLNGNPNVFYQGASGSYAGQMAGDFTWSISGVPEPTAWALMLAGTAALGGVVRGRRRQSASAAT